MVRTFVLDKVLTEHGLSVTELSRQSGVSRSTIDDIRRNNGSGRRRDNIERIAKSLGLSYDDLFFESEADATPLNARRSAGFDNKEMLALAEHYSADGNQAMSVRLSKLALRIGVGVEDLLDEGDAKYQSGDDKEAMGLYARAKDALQPRHFPRMKQSLRNYLALCAQEGSVPPIKFIYDQAKDCEYGDIDFFAQIGTFFARTRQSDALVSECFDLVSELIELEERT